MTLLYIIFALFALLVVAKIISDANVAAQVREQQKIQDEYSAGGTE